MEENTEATVVAADASKGGQIVPINNPNELTIWNDKQMLEEAWKRATMLAKTDIVPEMFKKPENTLIALDIANRTGLSPLAVMQNLYVVHGKPSWSGQMCISLVNGCGRFTPLEFNFVGEVGTDSHGCYATAKRLENGSVCFSDIVTIQMAKREGWYGKNGSKWQTMPIQMMMYRAGAFFARAHSPDVLIGLLTREEVEDVDGASAVKSKKPVSGLKDIIDEELKGGAENGSES